MIMKDIYTYVIFELCLNDLLRWLFFTVCTTRACSPHTTDISHTRLSYGQSTTHGHMHIHGHTLTFEHICKRTHTHTHKHHRCEQNQGCDFNYHLVSA